MEEQVRTPRRELSFASDTDSDLLGYMAMRSEDPEAASEAWEEFCHRHTTYLYAVLGKRGYAQRLGGGEHLEDLVQEILRRAFERAETFNDGGLSDSAALRRRTRGWLGAIAKNLFRDQLRAATRDPLWDSSGAEVLESLVAEEDDDRIDSEVIILGLEAWENLNERQQEVLRATAEFLKPGEKFQRMPSGSVRKLAESLDTTTAGIRMIRKRAIGVIRDYVEKRLKQRRRS